VRPVLDETLDIVFVWFHVFSPSPDHGSRPLGRTRIDERTHEAGQEAVRLLTTFDPAA
jgi:hypothetical protein